MDFLTIENIIHIQNARKTLYDLSERSRKRYYDLASQKRDSRLKEVDGYDLGIMTAAIEQAEDAMFNVLNIAKNYLNDPYLEDEEVLHANSKDVKIA